MTRSEQKLGIEELEALLEEIGLPADEAAQQDSSVNQLLGEILELTQPPSPSAATPSLPILPLQEEKRKRRSHSLIWMTAILLFGLLAGSGFGFFWARSQGIPEKPSIEPQEKIAIQVSHWIKELTTLYDKLEPPLPLAEPANEIIEPVLAPTEMEQLAPEERT